MRRFTNPGRTTQYEIAPLKDSPRRVRWRIAWCKLSEAFHPHSQAEWDAQQDA